MPIDNVIWFNFQIKHNKLVVAAIDFGTTYSGFAYCTRHDYNDYLKSKDNANPKIQCPPWSAGGWMNYKAPTCILFNPKQNFHSFGYEARQYYQDNPDKQDFTKWFYFEHFKMMLYREKVYYINISKFSVTMPTCTLPSTASVV